MIISQPSSIAGGVCGCPAGMFAGGIAALPACPIGVVTGGVVTGTIVGGGMDAPVLGPVGGMFAGGVLIAPAQPLGSHPAGG
jgi:hypothetical protein